MTVALLLVLCTPFRCDAFALDTFHGPDAMADCVAEMREAARVAPAALMLCSRGAL